MNAWFGRFGKKRQPEHVGVRGGVLAASEPRAVAASGGDAAD
jgi:hypothetical protein